MRLLHRHDRAPVAVSHQGAIFGTSVTSTVVLWRCECGDLTTQTLPGKWTLPEVRGVIELLPRAVRESA